MYNPSLLNKHRLFQSLGAASKAAKLTGPEDELIGRACSAIQRVVEMQAHADTCLQEFRIFQPQLTNPHRVVFWSPSLASYLAQISPFFSDIVRIQNLILRIAKPTGTIPGSLHDYINRAPRESYYGLSPEIHENIEYYWESCGKAGRAYRDIDQHFHSLGGQTYIEMADDTIRFCSYLPDDPKERSARRFTFEEKRDTISYSIDQLVKLSKLTNSIVSEHAESNIQLNIRMPTGLQELVDKGRKTLALTVYGPTHALEFGKNEGLPAIVYSREIAVETAIRLQLIPGNSFASGNFFVADTDITIP